MSKTYTRTTSLNPSQLPVYSSRSLRPILYIHTAVTLLVDVKCIQNRIQCHSKRYRPHNSIRKCCAHNNRQKQVRVRLWLLRIHQLPVRTMLTPVRATFIEPLASTSANITSQQCCIGQCATRAACKYSKSTTVLKHV